MLFNGTHSAFVRWVRPEELIHRIANGKLFQYSCFGKSHGQKRHGGLQSMESPKGWHDLVTKTITWWDIVNDIAFYTESSINS